jgi:hypothetical protein
VGLSVKVGVALGMSVPVGKGIFVGAGVSVGRGNGLKVVAGSDKRVFVAFNKGASGVEVRDGSTWVGIISAGSLHARRVRSNTKIIEIRFISRFYR